MNELLLLAAASFVVGFSGALMPGPMLVAVILQSTEKGYLTGPLVVVGHAALEVATIIALYFGLSTIIGSTTAKIVLGILGGGFLLWMGFDLFRYAKRASLRLEVEGGQAKLLSYGPIFSGIATSAMNPYFFLWWALVGNGFIWQALGIAGLIGVVIFAWTHWMSDLSWYTFISLSMHKGKRFLSDRAYGLILAICGIFLLAVSIKFIYDGLTALFQI